MTAAFYYIPSSSLSGIIIFAIKDLISRPKIVIDMYKFKLTDFLSFMVALIVTVFTSIETGIYSSVVFSILVLLYRVARPSLQFLALGPNGNWESEDNYGYLSKSGVAVFRVEESLTYPNANYVSEKVKIVVQKHTVGSENPDRERLWCEEDRRHDSENNLSQKNSFESFRIIESPSAQIHHEFQESAVTISLNLGVKGDNDVSYLKGLVLDCSAVNDIDSTGLQCLLDIRDDILRHAGNPVPFLFANVRKRLIPAIHTFHSIVTPRYQVTPMVAHCTPVAHQEHIVVVSEVDRDSLQHHHDDERSGCNLVFGSIDDCISAILA
jgi:sodium-independent sulfate anion transporter 11